MKSITQKINVAVLLLSLFFSQYLSANTYYVATYGDNNNNGTSLSTPFRDINYAVNLPSLTGGDIIYIRSGTYTERVIMTASGTSDASRILIKNYNNEVPVMDGTSVLWDYIDGVSGLFEIRSRYVTLDGLKVINVVANDNAAGILVRGPSTSFVTVIRCVTNNTRTSGIAIWGRTNGNDYSGATDIRIEACDISGAVNDGYHEHLTIAQGVDRYVIAWNKVHDQTLPGKFPNLPIGIDSKINVRNGKIYGNEVYNLYKANGIYIDAWDSEAYNIEIYNNTIHDVDYTGIPVGAEEGGFAHDIKVYNNLIYRAGHNGLALTRENNTLGTNVVTRINNVSFYNNTVYGCGYYAAHVLNLNTPGCSFKNNIFSENGFSNAITVYSTNKNNLSVENNITHGVQNAYLPGMEIAFGANNISQNPAFAYIGGNNYRLSPNSPAVNAGTSSLAPDNDLDWTPRPSGGAIDIGAYEFNLTPLPVALLNFGITKLQSNKNNLNWNTASEINLKHFVLEKSDNSSSWITAATIKANGTNISGYINTSNKNYQYTDDTPFEGTTYYRLKIVDNDLTFKYSKIVSATNGKLSLQVYPNPAKTNVYVAGLTINEKITLYNAEGKIVKIITDNNTSVLDINVNDLPSGFYTLKTAKQTIRFQKL